jgi:predicted dienelactone hydrolase
LRGLILLSHGTGGTELAHGRLAEALARHGFLVAALRHPGDNWQDRSLLSSVPQRYFDERPRQVSRVLDALLADADLRGRIAADDGGPRIGALGHSAGGYTVLALAGGVPSPARVAAHCEGHRAEDPIFCSMRSGSAPAAAAPAPETSQPLADKRLRAVAALAPLGVVFDAQSLSRVRIPVAVWEAEQDRFLVPAFHAEWVARNLPAPELHRVPGAWHFAFMDTPSRSIPSPDGDVAADPAGFDRAQFLDRLGEELAKFFDGAMAATASAQNGESGK